MSTLPTTDIAPELVAAMVRQHQVDQFLYGEAALLDNRSYDEWLALFSDDTHYWMPIRRTRMARQLDEEFTKPGEIAWFDDSKLQLLGRITKLHTGRSWAEDPPSRTRHLITNIRIVTDDGTEMEVHSNFHHYRTRLKSEETSWIGSRVDRIRRTEEGLRIAARTIYLEQTVLLSRNLSSFF